MTGPGLLNVPAETFKHILKFLRPDDIENLKKRVCKPLNQKLQILENSHAKLFKEVLDAAHVNLAYEEGVKLYNKAYNLYLQNGKVLNEEIQQAFQAATPHFKKLADSLDPRAYVFLAAIHLFGSPRPISWEAWDVASDNLVKAIDYLDNHLEIYGFAKLSIIQLARVFHGVIVPESSLESEERKGLYRERRSVCWSFLNGKTKVLIVKAYEADSKESLIAPRFSPQTAMTVDQTASSYQMRIG